MKLNVYAVLDAKVGVYGQPFYEATDPAAIRSFTDAVNDGSNPNNQWYKHPEDFTLYKIGEYDNNTGSISSNGISALVTASSLKELPRTDLKIN